MHFGCLVTALLGAAELRRGPKHLSSRRDVGGVVCSATIFSSTVFARLTLLGLEILSGNLL